MSSDLNVVDESGSILPGFSKEIKELAQYEASLLSLGIKVSPERWSRVMSLAGGWDPRVCFEPVADLSRFGSIWKCFLDSPRPRNATDNEDRLIVLGCVLYLLETRREEVTSSLALAGLKFFYTRREALLRTTGSLYYIALERLEKGDFEAGRRALAEQVKLTSQIEIKTLKPLSQKILVGQRGVALLTLARRDDEETAKTRLLAAIEDLEVSRKLGDMSNEHFQKEIETLARLYTLTNENRYLVKALPLADELAQRQERGLEFAPEIGFAYTLHAGYLDSKGDHEESLQQLNKAVDFLQLTVDRLTKSQRSEPHYLALATSQLKRYHLRHRLGETEVESDLDEILSNFKRAGSLATDQPSSYGSALLLKASKVKSGGAVGNAIQFIDRALGIPPSAKPTEQELEVRYALNVLKVECLIWLAHGDSDKSKLREVLTQMLDLIKPGDGAVAAIAQAVRDLHGLADTPTSDPLFERALVAIEEAAASGKHSSEAARFATSNAGTICLQLYGLEDLSFVERAHKWFLNALDASDSQPPPQLLSWLASTSSTIGQFKLRESKREESLSFLEDAKDYHLAAIAGVERAPSQSLDLSVLHSKLAVLCLRLNALTGDLADAKAADFHMNQAIALGGEFPERYGYLGDAQYRIGRAARDPKALQNAVQYKRRARNMAEGGVSRENPSVTAAALLRLWIESQDVKEICEAVDEVALAIKIDPSWPWPYFQLAEILEEAGSERIQKDGKSYMSVGAGQLLESVAFDATKARLQGCWLAVRTKEFERKNLGGRRANQVHVLDDPHGLLRETVVFKIERHNVADRETRLITSLDKILTATHAPARFQHAKPIGVVFDQNGQCWYATQFQYGHDLGRIIYHVRQRGALTPGRYDQLLSDAVRFLALFHISAGILTGAEPRARQRLNLFWTCDVSVIDKLLHRGGNALSDGLRKLISQALPLCLKKDAHPENWLVTANDEIVMLDFEGSRRLPIIYEVAQLLEDYPAIPIDEAGWEHRKELVKLYMDTLVTHDSTPDLSAISSNNEDLERTYAVFACIRAFLGLHRLSLPSDKVIASSAARLSDFRKKHYEALLAAFESGWGTTALAPLLKDRSLLLRSIPTTYYLA